MSRYLLNGGGKFFGRSGHSFYIGTRFFRGAGHFIGLSRCVGGNAGQHIGGFRHLAGVARYRFKRLAHRSSKLRDERFDFGLARKPRICLLLALFFQATAGNCVFFKHVNRPGHIAQFVLALGAFYINIQIALGQICHGG